MSKVLVISTSLRAGSNSGILAGKLIAGAKDAGHEAERICGGISDSNEAAGKDRAQEAAYEFGRRLR